MYIFESSKKYIIIKILKLQHISIFSIMILFLGGIDTGKRFYVKIYIRNEVLDYFFHSKVFKI